MNLHNLTQEEVKLLHSLLGKMLEEPKQKVYLDPVNQMIDKILDEFNFEVTNVLKCDKSGFAIIDA